MKAERNGAAGVVLALGMPGAQARGRCEAWLAALSACERALAGAEPRIWELQACAVCLRVGCGVREVRGKGLRYMQVADVAGISPCGVTEPCRLC